MKTELEKLGAYYAFILDGAAPLPPFTISSQLETAYRDSQSFHSARNTIRAQREFMAYTDADLK